MELDQRVQYWPGIPEESLLYIFTYNEITLVDSVDLNEHSVRLYSSADETRTRSDKLKDHVTTYIVLTHMTNKCHDWGDYNKYQKRKKNNGRTEYTRGNISRQAQTALLQTRKISLINLVLSHLIDRKCRNSGCVARSLNLGCSRARPSRGNFRF